MMQIFYQCFTNTINITFYIALLILLEPLLKKYFSAVCLYRIWLILLIGLFIPQRFEFTKALFYINSQRNSVADYTVSVTDLEGHNVFLPTYDQFALPKKQMALDSWMTYYNPQEEPVHHLRQLLVSKLDMVQNKYFILCLIWLAGVFFLLAFHCIRYYRYVKQLKRFMLPINKEAIKEEVEICIRELDDHRKSFAPGFRSRYKKIKVYQCSVITSPLTIGILKPAIILPDENYQKKEVHFIIKHELIHIRRRDSFVKLIRLIVLSLYWYNPLCYVLSGRLDRWCEASCDEQVVHESTKADCMDYGKLLIKCVAGKRDIAPLINLYGGKNNMKLRLQSIMDRGKKHSGMLLVVLLLTIVFTTVIVSSGNHSTSPEANNDISTEDKEVTTFAEEEVKSPVNRDEVTAEKVTANTNQENGDLTAVEATDSKAKNVSDLDSLRAIVVDNAKQAEDTPYLWGGNDLAEGVDSSGFVQAIYEKSGYALPRTSREMLKDCEEVAIDSLLPGDIIFYAGSDDMVNHVGIYIGDDKIIHAANARVGVVIRDMNYRTPHSAGRVITG